MSCDIISTGVQPAKTGISAYGSTLARKHESLSGSPNSEIAYETKRKHNNQLGSL